LEEKETSKVIVTLVNSKRRELERKAAEKGVGLPTYCRMLLSEMASKQEE